MKDHPTNPRTLSKKAHDDLLKSFNEFDYVELIAINLDGTILAGHQRVHIMIELGWQDQEIDVRVPNFQLSEKKANEYLIRSNANVGEWDFEILGDCFDSNDLLAFGIDEKFLLKGLGTPKFEVEDEKNVPDLTEREKKTCPQCGVEL